MTTNNVLVAENSKVVIYTGSFSAEHQPQDDRPIILVYDGKPYDPNISANEVLEDLASIRQMWELLPERNPGLSMTRQEVEDFPFSEGDPRLGVMPTSRRREVVRLFSHFAPSLMIRSLEDIKEWGIPPSTNVREGGSRAGFKVFNTLVNFSRPLFDYSCLEAFCEYRLGPSIRPTHIYHSFRDQFYACQDEEEATALLANHGHTEDPYHGLDLLFPEYETRIARLRQFEADWFPSEIIKARVAYEQTREWLLTLKD